MRIGIDGWSVATGGNVTYFANLLPELARLCADRGHEVYVYVRKGGRVSVPALPGLIERASSLPGLEGPRRAAWEQTALPAMAARDRLDLLYGPGDAVPLAATCPTVCAFRNPNVYAPLSDWPLRERPRLAVLRALAIASAQRSRRAIFVSEAARDAILPTLRIDPAKARVVHHGLGGVFLDALTGPDPVGRPYLLTVSTIYRYKNVVRLVEAFDAHVVKAGLPHALAIVGSSSDAPYWAELQATVDRLGLSDRVLMPGEVRYPQVGAWYRHAAAFVFPSFRETFGHPLVEAMAAGLPVAAADIPVMREVGGTVPSYFDPMSVASMGAALRDVLDPSRRDVRAQAGRSRAAEFSWARTAAQTLQVFEEAAG